MAKGGQFGELRPCNAAEPRFYVCIRGVLSAGRGNSIYDRWMLTVFV